MGRRLNTQRPLAQPTILSRVVQQRPEIALDLFRRYLVDVVNVLNSATQGVGAVVASATTLKPTNAIHHVTGTAAIDTIVAPPGFTGPLFLIADDGFSFTTGGNISTAGTVAAGTEAMLIYDGATWYPIVGSGSVPPSNVVTVTSVSVSSAVVLATVETVILADPTAGAIVLSLPAAALNANKLLYVKNVTLGANSVTLDPNGAETIDGIATQIIFGMSDIEIACNGLAWYIV